MDKIKSSGELRKYYMHLFMVDAEETNDQGEKQYRHKANFAKIQVFQTIDNNKTVAENLIFHLPLNVVYEFRYTDPERQELTKNKFIRFPGPGKYKVYLMLYFDGFKELLLEGVSFDKNEYSLYDFVKVLLSHLENNEATETGTGAQVADTEQKNTIEYRGNEYSVIPNENGYLIKNLKTGKEISPGSVVGKYLITEFQTA